MLPPPDKLMWRHSPDMGPDCDLKRACSVGGQTWPDGAGRETFFRCPCCEELPTMVERGQVPPGLVGEGGDHQPEPAIWVCRRFSEILGLPPFRPHPSGLHTLSSQNSTSKSWPKSKLAEVDRAQLEQFKQHHVSNVRNPPFVTPDWTGCRLGLVVDLVDRHVGLDGFNFVTQIRIQKSIITTFSIVCQFLESSWLTTCCPDVPRCVFVSNVESSASLTRTCLATI